MRPQTFVLRFLVMVIICFLVWYFFRSKTLIPDKMAAMPTPVHADAPKAIAQPQIAQPLAPPVQVKPETARSAPIADALVNADPRSNLDTAIAEIIRLYEANDNITRVKEFFTQDDLDRVKSTMNISIEEWVHISEQYPEAAYNRENDLAIWRSMQGQTPRMSGNGNIATYETVTLDGSHKKAALKKHDGLWYIDYVEP